MGVHEGQPLRPPCLDLRSPVSLTLGGRVPLGPRDVLTSEVTCTRAPRASTGTRRRVRSPPRAVSRLCGVRRGPSVLPTVPLPTDGHHHPSSHGPVSLRQDSGRLPRVLVPVEAGGSLGIFHFVCCPGWWSSVLPDTTPPRQEGGRDYVDLTDPPVLQRGRAVPTLHRAPNRSR